MPLKVYTKAKLCYQGQTHGHDGFLLNIEQAKNFLISDHRNAEILFPYLIARELVGRKNSLPTRYVIYFHPRNQLSAQMYSALFERLKKTVLPDRQKAATEEEQRNKEALQDRSNARINHHRQNFLNKWWLLSYP